MKRIDRDALVKASEAEQLEALNRAAEYVASGQAAMACEQIHRADRMRQSLHRALDELSYISADMQTSAEAA